jgi:hypothetical protein
MSFSRSVRRRSGERHPLLALRDEPGYMVGGVCAWIWMSMVPSRRVYRHATSYGLKHAVEEALGTYVPNDLFKGCMILQGFEVADLDALNWEFKVKPRYGRIDDRHRTGIGVDRDRADPTELALFDSIASWARLNAYFDSQRRRERAGYDDPPTPLVMEEDREVFRRARRMGLGGPNGIDREIYQAITGDCQPPRPRRSVSV